MKTINAVIKRRSHIVDMPCPNGQTFCIRECNNSIRGCALCEPYAYGRDKRGNIPPNFPMPAIRKPIHPVEIYLLDVLIPKLN